MSRPLARSLLVPVVVSAFVLLPSAFVPAGAANGHASDRAVCPAPVLRGRL